MKRRLCLLLLCFSVFGCTATARINVPPRSGEQTTEPGKLHEIFEDYFEEYVKLFPTFATFIGDHRYDDQLSIAISDEHREKQRALHAKFLSEIVAVNSEGLGQQDRLDHAVFKHLLAQRLEDLKFEQHLMPVRQLSSLVVEFPLMGSAQGIHPFKAPADYDNFLKRIEQFRQWVDTAIENTRPGSGAWSGPAQSCDGTRAASN